MARRKRKPEWLEIADAISRLYLHGIITIDEHYRISRRYHRWLNKNLPDGRKRARLGLPKRKEG